MIKFIFILFFVHSHSARVLAKKAVVTEQSLKSWVNSTKRQLKKVVAEKGGLLGLGPQKALVSLQFNTLLSQSNQELQAMQPSRSVSKSRALSKDNKFLLYFQLSSLKELFPILLKSLKKEGGVKSCAYLKQKIIQDIYPSYENIKNIKLPYAHKELINLLRILCVK